MDTMVTTDTTIALACARAHGLVAMRRQYLYGRFVGRDVSARGRCREHWLVYRSGAWQYYGERLGPVGDSADTRYQTTRGDAYLGELIARHDRGGPVNAMYIVAPPTGEPQKKITPLAFRRRRDGQIDVSLPDGSTVTVPDPRRR